MRGLDVELVKVDARARKPQRVAVSLVLPAVERSCDTSDPGAQSPWPWAGSLA